jgi:hypothetical protein
MVCQSYNLSNPHIEEDTVHGYAATVGYVSPAFWRSFRHTEDGESKLL